MSDSSFLHPSPRWRWLVWIAFVLLWTTALLTTFPITVRDALLPEDAGFPAGKTLHVVAYAIFTVLSGWVGVPGRRRWLLLAFVSFHAFATEFFQQFVERTPSWADVGLDHVGLVIGLALSWRWWRIGERRCD
jgi:VanZ family protein